MLHCYRMSCLASDASLFRDAAALTEAGVMLLKPDQAVFDAMSSEIFDYEHPEHYETYMPEQEYLSRFYGTFDKWTHISCQYNFEIDKNERIPHDFSVAHENIRNGAGHKGAVVLHYSGASSPQHCRL